MKIFIIKRVVGILFLLLIISNGCKKILSPELQGQISVSNLVTTQSGIMTLVNGVYNPLIDMYNGTLSRLTDLASNDGWTPRVENDPDYLAVGPGFNFTTNFWSGSYKGIVNANAVLANADAVPDFSSVAIKNSVKGQSYFLRAFYYFNLVRLFGGVPLILNQVNSQDDAQQPRASMEDVYAQIKNDLDSAIALLPPSYNGSMNQEVGRATSYSAIALKTLVYLETNEWANAAAAANSIISSNKFSLQGIYANNFNGSAENGSQSLFEVQYSATAGSYGNLYQLFAPAAAPYSSGFTIAPTDDSLVIGGVGGPNRGGQSFVQAFESGDLRKNTIITAYNIPNVLQSGRAAGTLYYVNKYLNITTPAGQSPWNVPVIRYAEILLAGAEALNETSYVADGPAFNMLNEVRQKAGLPGLTSATVTTQSEFRTALQHERRIELAFECKSFFDLNRWGILSAAIQPQLDNIAAPFPASKQITNPFTKMPYYLYPLPAYELANNAKIGSQNPGY
ncbi:MAG: RagB/SusD family nutrient uptake outer membrane protein [Sphingobacteriales bacterium]|nr:RagB/SusD family nutrient uptake outer membrane protein [Sphingobacteriales bacterium]OJY81055.1 MAG: hypothetical protein BGP14_07460 [Sphingobacteriales bacterium 44-15]